MTSETSARELFPILKNHIFFDHARVAPLPQVVRKAITDFANDACENGTANYAYWDAEIDKTRNRFARFINAEVDEVAFVKNTSEGIAIVANGLDWNPGDNVVIPDIEFPANVYPWQNLRRHGVETRFVKAVDGRVLFDDIVSKADARTRVISISSVECNSGFRTDLKRIGSFCKEQGILFCVDAIQSLGVTPMDVKRDHIDFLSADGHKWLLSVEGLGGFFISKQVLDKVYPVTVGWNNMIDASDYMNYRFEFRPDAQRYEEGSLNTMSIHAFGAALSIFESEGIDNVQRKIFRLGDLVIENLRKRNINIISSTKPEERSGNISFIPNGDLQALSIHMQKNKVKLTARNGLMRVSPHFYNTEDEVEKFFSLLDAFKK